MHTFRPVDTVENANNVKRESKKVFEKWREGLEKPPRTIPIRFPFLERQQPWTWFIRQIHVQGVIFLGEKEEVGKKKKSVEPKNKNNLKILSLFFHCLPKLVIFYLTFSDSTKNGELRIGNEKKRLILRKEMNESKTSGIGKMYEEFKITQVKLYRFTINFN